MGEVTLRPFAVGDTERVVALWQECGLTRPWNDPRKDIDRKLRVQPELFLVAAEATGEGERVVGTAMSGYDGHRGWIYYLAVAPELRRRGIAAALVSEVRSRLLALGCPKISVQIRRGNDTARDFWSRAGFAADGSDSMGQRLIED